MSRGQTGVQLEFLNDAKVLRVTMGPQLLSLLLPLTILDETPQHSHLLMEVLRKVKAVLFRQPQLTVVVVETLLADPQHTGSLLQIDLLPGVVGLRTAQMQSPPTLHQLDRLPHRPLPTPHVPSLPTVRLEIRPASVTRIRLHSLTVTQQDHGRLENPAREEVSFGCQFPEGDEGVDVGVVEGDIGPGGEVGAEDGGEVDAIAPPVDFQLVDLGLHGQLPLKDKGPRDLLVRCHWLQHKFQFFRFGHRPCEML